MKAAAAYERFASWSSQRELESMHDSIPIRSEALAEADDLSLFRGGLLYRVQVLLRLMTPDRWNFPGRIALVLAVSWLPLVLLTISLHPEQLKGLLTDYAIYSRIVVAIPVLLVAQFLMETRFGVLVTHLRRAELLDEAGQAQLSGVITLLKRLRDSLLPEIIILALVVGEVALTGRDRVLTGAGWAALRNGTASHLTAAGWYYLVVSVPLYQFLLLLNGWKWLVWSFFLFRVSRMDLKLVATHPDTRGGLGFLGLSPAAFAPVAFVIAAVIGAAWRHKIVHSGAKLADFELSAIILLLLIFLIELGPIGFFVPKLMMLRQRAMLEYGVLGQMYASNFHTKWILFRKNRREVEQEIPDVTTLANFAISFGNIKRMQPFPVEKGALIGLALAVVVPLLPVVLAEIPLSAIVKGLIETVRAVPI